MRFFKKLAYSIYKIEKYPDMSAEGVRKAITYIIRIVAILAIILSLGMIYKTHNLVNQGVNYLQNEFPEFTYKDGELDVQTDEEIVISEDNAIVGKTIIDTKTESGQQINQYTNEIIKSGEGLLILKDRIIIKNSSVAGTITYSYKGTLEPLGVTEFVKEDVINYANSTKILALYISVFLTIFIYSFIMYLLTTISNAVLLSFFGYIASLLARIKMRYLAIFNMSVYALTLSTILNILYILVNIFTQFSMTYFQVMYVSVAAIYLVAAILILKSDIIKNQMELTKIVEAEAIIKKELEDQEQEEKDEKEKEERRKKDREEEKKEQQKNKGDESGNMEEEPEGA